MSSPSLASTPSMPHCQQAHLGMCSKCGGNAAGIFKLAGFQTQRQLGQSQHDPASILITIINEV